MISQIKPNVTNNHTAFTPFIDKDSVKYPIVTPFNTKDIKEAKKHKNAEKEKKSNALGLKFATLSVGVGLGVLGLMKGLPKGTRLKADKLFKKLENKISQMSKNKHLTAFQKFSLGALNKLKDLTNKTKGLANISPLKDASFKAVTNKVPVLKRICANITTAFEKISIRTSKISYNKTMSHFDDSYAIFSEANTKLNKNQQLRINEVIKRIKATYQEGFTADARMTRHKQTKTDLSGLHQKVTDKIGKVKKLVTNKETYTTYIPDEFTTVPKANLKNSITPHREKISKDMDELLSIYKESLPEQEFLKIKKHANNSLKSLDKSINIESNKLFDKMQELEIGSAPTDTLSILAAVGVIGVGLTKADNNDERISVALKYGIPALGAVATSLYCTVGLISGGPALALGLVAGTIINKIGSAADKSRKELAENPKVLPKLNLLS